jgi:hypothetical protein
MLLDMEAQMQAEYATIGKHLTLRVSVKDLDRATQVGLWRELNEQLGVAEAVYKAPAEVQDWLDKQYVRLNREV